MTLPTTRIPAGWLLLLLGALGLPVAAHEELTQEQIEQFAQEGSLADRQNRVATLNQFRMTEGSRQRAIYRIRRAELEAAGLSPAEAARALTAGPAMAYPYTATPELRSKGTVRTLTVLIDFADFRAASELRGLTVETFRDNIYGDGTEIAATFRPHESVHAYYRRASQELVNLQGTVLDWHHFSAKRKDYEPEKASPELPLATRRQVQARNDNRAIFKLLSEVLDSVDKTHDFAQYDNDNDDDIDLVTILYAGPQTGWGSFWWAYRWEFFVPEAKDKTFDGKHARQFVFQFVETRGPASADFDPTTLMHETGHAFGLTDYYDYDPDIGPPGGVGGLDMMHANKGNHNAFSRWLLDWIRPSVLGAGAPELHTLVASGSTRSSNKALAIFPNLSATDAPGGELFIIENRFPTGNDALLPGRGLLIWHVDATVKSSDDDFEFDNSFTDRKLIRLVRADDEHDFGPYDSATENTYFTTANSFTPNSNPSSKNHSGQDTGIVIDQIDAASETMRVRIGFASGAAAGDAISPPAQTGSTAVAKVSIESILSSEEQLTLDDLEALDQQFIAATADSLANYWTSFRDSKNAPPESRLVVLKLLASRWASKNGAAAAAAVMALPTTDKLRKDALSLALDSWVNSDPSEAALWYLSDQQVDLRTEDWLTHSRSFTRDAFRGLYLSDWKRAIEGLGRLSDVADVVSAVDGVFDSSQMLAENPETLSERLFAADSDVAKVRAEMLLDLSVMELRIEDPRKRKDFRELIFEEPER